MVQYAVVLHKEVPGRIWHHGAGSSRTEGGPGGLDCTRWANRGYIGEWRDLGESVRHQTQHRDKS